MSTRVCITNVFGPLNRGDHELFERLVGLVLATDPTASITAIVRDPEGASNAVEGPEYLPQPGVRPTGDHSRIIWLLHNLAATVMLFLAAQRWWPKRLLPRRESEAAAAVAGADLVIACPGGYLEDGSRSFLPQIAQTLLATRRSRLAVLAPMSIGPLAKPASRMLVRRALVCADRVYVRESASFTLCRQLQINADRSADLALALSGPAHKGPTKGGYIAATVVRFDFSRLDHVAPDIKEQHYLTSMARTLDFLAKQVQLPVSFLLQVTGDDAPTRTVAQQLSVPYSIFQPAGPRAYRDHVRGATALVASRFHSGIFGMTEGTPTFVISYLPKARATMQDLGLEDYCAEIGNLPPPETIANRLLLAIENEAEAQRIRDALTRARRPEANPFLEYLSNYLAEAG